ncbi:hypothetical protein G3R49_19250 [Shewanella sp. WXL01]|uniref:hypothetical protein n=1 Tax=Shewanella sp. WXL01 TaxID=2709721 RepID=UPI0014384711|nr:hypothetical protein [Shewanella sp. WXL01]NKF52696.1 hypothetical protein [Shewanella sp. WXL01]
MSNSWAPMDTPLQQKFWASEDKWNTARAIIASSVNEIDAMHNLRRKHDGSRWSTNTQRRRILNAFKAHINKPSFVGVPFRGDGSYPAFDVPWWLDPEWIGSSGVETGNTITVGEGSNGTTGQLGWRGTSFGSINTAAPYFNDRLWGDGTDNLRLTDIYVNATDTFYWNTLSWNVEGKADGSNNVDIEVRIVGFNNDQWIRMDGNNTQFIDGFYIVSDLTGITQFFQSRIGQEIVVQARTLGATANHWNTINITPNGNGVVTDNGYTNASVDAGGWMWNIGTSSPLQPIAGRSFVFKYRDFTRTGTGNVNFRLQGEGQTDVVDGWTPIEGDSSFNSQVISVPVGYDRIQLRIGSANTDVSFDACLIETS